MSFSMRLRQTRRMVSCVVHALIVGIRSLTLTGKSFTPTCFTRVSCVRNPILSHIDPACNTSYHFAASRTVFPRVPPYLARDRLHLLAHVYDSVASIHMTKNPGRHGVNPRRH